MTTDRDSSDAFDPPPPPIPTKRRKLNPQPEQQQQQEDKVPVRRQRRANSYQESDSSNPPKKVRKPKHRIHIPKNQPPPICRDGFLLGGHNLLSRPPAIGQGLLQGQNESPSSTPQELEADVDQTKESTPNPILAPIAHDDFRKEATVETLVVENSNGADEAGDSFKVTVDKGGISNANKSPSKNFDHKIAQELLQDLPSDAFSSSEFSPTKAPNENPIYISSSQPDESTAKKTNARAPQGELHQTTLFGGRAQQSGSNMQTSTRQIASTPRRDEPPTHHKLNMEELKTWVYPMNLGAIRDYQYNIVARGLFHNLLVALPTGLGKTFIAATIMLNWFRWTKEAQIVFVAPTKPLVSQQVEACLGIAGIPRSQTTMLTGGISPALRAEEWSSKRVFFMTPQTIMNDLKTGICDPKKIVLLVVDEAHRATGAYAYNELVKFIRRFNQSFRVLGLTATPGGSVEAVQEVIDGLDIARVEIRTEFSIDIRQFVHSRKTDVIPFENSMEIELIMEQLSKAIQPVLNKLNQFNAYWSKDPMSLTAFGLTKARERWMKSDAARNANAAVKAMIYKISSVLASLAHSIELLKYHGIGPFFQGMVAFRNNVESSSRGGSKYEREIAESESFQNMMRRIQMWINNAAFIGHPKLEFLQELVLNHFMDAGAGRDMTNNTGPSETRVMIFAHYRDSAEEIVRVLKRNEPMIRPHVFVGQAASKSSEGMDQKQQLEILQKFKNATFNTLVATSIGEEGLDIGEIDLIICYDASASPIRMLQRMGRTGRKRAGNIKMLLMKGKEENSFAQAKDGYEKMQKYIADGKNFVFHDDRSARIVPKDVQPLVDKQIIEIPVENTQAALPEPKRRAKAPKRPPKKFHMPDGVRTGFVSASRLQDDEDGESEDGQRRIRRPKKPENTTKEIVDVPRLGDILLNETEKGELARQYQDIAGDFDEDVVISKPQLNLHHARQLKQGKTKFVKHGRSSKDFVSMVKTMHAVDDNKIEQWKSRSHKINLDRLCNDTPALVSESESEGEMPEPVQRATKVGPQGRPGRPRKPTVASNAAEAPSSEAPATSPRLQIRSQAISLGSDTSGEDEDDGEPDSELREFVVDSDAMESDPDIGLTSSLSLPQPRRKPTYVSQDSVDIHESSDSDLELPYMKSHIQTHVDDPEYGNDSRRDSGIGHVSQGKAVPERKRARKVIEDSSE